MRRKLGLFLLATACGGAPALPPQPQISVSPPGLYFDSDIGLGVWDGTIRTGSLQILNGGQQPLVLQSVTLGGTGAGAYQMSGPTLGDGGTLPLSVPSGQSAFVQLTFKPPSKSAPVCYAASLAIASNAQNAATLDVPVQAAGIPASEADGGSSSPADAGPVCPVPPRPPTQADPCQRRSPERSLQRVGELVPSAFAWYLFEKFAEASDVRSMTAALLISLLFAGSVHDRARGLARRSIVEYDAGDFERALADAQRAYELDPAPGLLYDLGQCHRALHHWEQAEFFYRGYLRRGPNAPNREAVLALIAQMQERQRTAAAPPAGTAAKPEAPSAGRPKAAAAAPPPATVPTPRPAPPAPAAAVGATPAARTVPVGAWVTGGAGVVAVAVGVVLGVEAASLRTGDGSPPSSGVWFHSVPRSQFDRANSDALAGDVLVDGGAILLVGALLWAILGRTAEPTAGLPVTASF